MKNLFLPEIDYNAPSEYNMRTYDYWNLKNESAHDYYCIENVFTARECLEIIKLGNQFNISDSTVDTNVVNKNVRKSRNSWLKPCELTLGIYEKIQNTIFQANELFNFDLQFLESMQFTEYDENNNGFYEKHIDKFSTSFIPSSHRKLTLSVQLSNPENYEGGDLMIHNCNVPTIANKKQGCINFFPSYVLHEVTPITKGKRYSLVAWINGPKFK